MNFGMAFLKKAKWPRGTSPACRQRFCERPRTRTRPPSFLWRGACAPWGLPSIPRKAPARSCATNGIPSQAIFRISTGRPHVLDMIQDKQGRLIVNTPSSGENSHGWMK